MTLRLPHFLFLSALLVTSVAAQTLRFVPEQYPTIQAAIVASVPGDTVEVGPGTWAEAIDFLGKDLRVIAREGPHDTIIDASGLQRSAVLFIRGETQDAFLTGFTITGGLGTLALPGGGITCVMSSPSIQNCIVRQNAGFQAMQGFEGGAGGISSHLGGNPTIVHCVVTGNVGGSTPGSFGIPSFEPGGVRGPARIYNSIIRDNTHGSISTPMTVEYSNVEGGASGPGNIDAPPVFIAPQFHNYHISSISPGRDAGNDAAPRMPTQDCDGEPRTAGFNPLPDMGVDEIPVIRLVPSNIPTLEAAVALSPPGTIIRVEPGVHVSTGVMVRNDLVIESLSGRDVTTIRFTGPPLASPGGNRRIVFRGLTVDLTGADLGTTGGAISGGDTPYQGQPVLQVEDCLFFSTDPNERLSAPLVHATTRGSIRLDRVRFRNLRTAGLPFNVRPGSSLVASSCLFENVNGLGLAMFGGGGSYRILNGTVVGTNLIAPQVLFSTNERVDVLNSILWDLGPNFEYFQGTPTGRFDRVIGEALTAARIPATMTVGSFAAHDPQFLNAAGGAFEPAPCSPAVDAGDPLVSESRFDLTGAARQLLAGTDIGAIESTMQGSLTASPGTGDDFVLYTNGTADQCKAALVGAITTIEVRSASSAFTGAPFAIAGHVGPTGSAFPTFPSIPIIHFDLGAPGFFFLVDHVTTALPGFSAGFPPSDFAIAVRVPAMLVGQTIHLQAVALSTAASNGAFAATAAHDLIVR